MKKIIHNYYPDKLSFFEALGKEFRYCIAGMKSRMSHAGRVVRVLTYPELPGSKSIIYKLSRHNRWVLTNNPRKKCDFAIAWQDRTLRDDFPVLRDLQKKMPVLNLHCNNIMKTYIDEFVYEVFGFKTRINPSIHNGPAVLKSEWNATHSGEIVQCPVDTVEENCIYQIVINNKTEDGFFEDIRVPVAAGAIPFVYIKLKSPESRFETKASKVLLKQPDDILSADEQQKILEFARIIGLDFGEVDVLRNRDDGRIYVVDVNNTPYGPPANLDEHGRETAIEKLSEKLAIINKSLR